MFSKQDNTHTCLPSQILFSYSYSLLPPPLLEAELAPKREVPSGEATALEALLRGDNLLEKKNSICKEEETLLEIQVLYYARLMHSIIHY